MNRRPLAPALSSALVTILCACTTPREVPPELAGPPPPPELGFQPPTWASLDEVEHWLAGSGPRAHPEERVEAELYLAQGRLAFAREEAAGLPGPVLERRLASARAGFERVLGDHAATGLQRHHARRGLDEARALAAGGAPAEPAKGLALHGRASWGARPAAPARLTRNAGGWRRITVHHSAPPASRARPSTSAQVEDELRRIQRHHMEGRGFGDIGYHYLISPDGLVYEGRSLAWQGAHASGDHNRRNIGVCLLGDFERDAPTPAALTALERLLDDLTARHRIPPDARGVLGHGELRPTECPGRHLRSWLDAYRARASRTADARR